MKEALKLALEALENHCGNYKLDDAGCERWNKAVAAIKEALAQPDYRAVKTYHEGKPVYVSQPEQEPVATTYKEVTDAMNLLLNGGYKQVQMAQLMADAKLYTTPPKRPWVGLTDEEMNDITCGMVKGWVMEQLAQAIETKLRELNT